MWETGPTFNFFFTKMRYEAIEVMAVLLGNFCSVKGKYV